MINDITTRYERANTYQNTVVTPYWIEDSPYFWYQRGTAQGKEYRLVNVDFKR